MTAITGDMVTRALGVIMTEPGLDFRDTEEAPAHNREVVRRALDAALNVKPEGEDEVRRVTRAAMANPGKTASIGPDGDVVLSPAGDS